MELSLSQDFKLYVWRLGVSGSSNFLSFKTGLVSRGIPCVITSDISSTQQPGPSGSQDYRHSLGFFILLTFKATPPYLPPFL